MKTRSLLNGVAIINAFIMGITVVIVELLPWNYAIKLLIAFGIILVLMFSLYYMYGKYLNKKWGKKDGV